MMNVWRNNRIVAGLITIIRIVLGYEWMTAGWNKLTGDKAFDAGGYLGNAVANPVMDKATGEALYPTYNAFIEHVALPNVKLINFIIPIGELLVGIGLILGALTVTAAFFGLMMNFMFMFAGTVSTNPWLILLGVLVLIAGTNAGYFGGDRFLLPWLKANVGDKLKKKTGNEVNAPGTTA
ncbi:DoxX family membrane protein [Paenibacillus sp. GCM10027627]|uniref:DoxX family membrane protein n=1 Tax=unclassified Paenibacillus TaxID=185978 RepID=UPI003636670C